MRELLIAGAMVKVPVRMDDKQGSLCRSVGRKQLPHRVRQGHQLRICNIAAVDQQGLRRSNEKVDEWCLESGTKVLPKDECPLIICMHLNGRLRDGLAVLCPNVPVNVHRSGHEFRPGKRGGQKRPKSQQDVECVSQADRVPNGNRWDCVILGWHRGARYPDMAAIYSHKDSSNPSV